MNRTLASLLALTLLGGSALAQKGPPPPGVDAPIDGPNGPPPPPGGPRGMRPPPPPPSKAAHFRLQRGDVTLDVKCADDESMKACADLAMQMLDKVGTLPKP